MNSIEIWSVPVPVRRSTFESACPEHARYNVEVDLAQIGAFGFARGRPPPAELLFADLQCNADGHVRHRLGSGRSGYHAGKYLKGVGRTPLAANWSDDDRYHASGHMLASAAARESLVSTVVEAAGRGRTINACEAVLVRAVTDADAAWIAGLRAPHSVAAADLRLQAITVKDGGFARLSNFLWALDHFEVARSWLPDYLLAVRCALGPPGDCPRPEDITPRDIAEAFAASVSRALDHFSVYRSLGIDWGSYHNNFTADGRFLDLEVPLVFGQPVIGWISRAGGDPRAGRWVGIDAVGYLRQVRDFIAAYRARLRALPIDRFDDTAAEYIGELVAELDAAFGREHIVFHARRLASDLLSALTRELDLGATARRDLAVVLEDQQRPRGHMPAADWESLDLREVARTFACAEGGPGWALRVPASMMDRVDPRFPGAELFERAVADCDEATTIDQYFQALSRGKMTLASTRSRHRAPAA